MPRGYLRPPALRPGRVTDPNYRHQECPSNRRILIFNVAPVSGAHIRRIAGGGVLQPHGN